MNEIAVREARGPVTTDGAIALTNLDGQIDGLAEQVAQLGLSDAPDAQRCAALIDLLLLRGQLRGWIGGYAAAQKIATALIDATAGAAEALLARARVHATLHRFGDALADLHAAVRFGLDKDTGDAERIAILQALGADEVAEQLIAGRKATASSYAVRASLAVLFAGREDFAEAEKHFDAARAAYSSTSPFPLAQLDFQRGLMWMRAKDYQRARRWLAASEIRLPGYAPAAGHLAEIDIAEGKFQSAIARLLVLAEQSDDPEYAATLGTALLHAGRVDAAQSWINHAAERYDELVGLYPEAYRDHAALFWLTAGANAERGLELALETFGTRQTVRAHRLLEMARRKLAAA